MKTCGRVIVLQNENNEILSCYANIKELKQECARSYKKCDFSEMENGIITCDNLKLTFRVMEVVG